MKTWMTYFLIGCLVFFGGGLLLKADYGGWGMAACVVGVLVMTYGFTRRDSPTE